VKSAAGAPASGISLTQLASACLREAASEGRGIFEQPERNDILSNIADFSNSETEE
jgi:hypothetical protein